MKKALKTLVPATFMLLVALLVLATASFAWFNMALQTTAKGMQVQIVAPNNLLISAKTSDWQDTDWSESVSINQTAVIVPSSTFDGKSFVALTDGSTVSSDGNLVSGSVFSEGIINDEVADKAYMDFVVYVKTEGNENVEIYLDSITVEAQLGHTAVTEPIRIAVDATEVCPVYNAGGGVNFDGKVVKRTSADGVTPVTYEMANAVYSNVSDQTAQTLILIGRTPKRITVRVWFEGQDNKCTGVAAQSAIAITVTFNTKQN